MATPRPLAAPEPLARRDTITAPETIVAPEMLPGPKLLAVPYGVAAPETLNDWLYEPRWTLAEPRMPRLAANLSPRLPGHGEGPWLIFTGLTGIGAALEASLVAHGETCLHVLPSGSYERAEVNRYLVDPRSPADFERLMADIFPDDERACRGVVHMWSMAVVSPWEVTSDADSAESPQPSLSNRLGALPRWTSACPGQPSADLRNAGAQATRPGRARRLESAPPAVTTPRLLDAALELGCISVVYMVQALARMKWTSVPRLWLVTRGAQAVNDETEIAVVQSPLWGLGRVVSQEHPELRCVRLDLDPAGTTEESDAIVHELLKPDDEDEIALRGTGRYVHRLVRYGS